MAVKHLTNVDLNKNELQNAKIHPLAADPTPAAGDKGYMIYNTSTNLLKVWNGASFDVVTTGTISNMMTTDTTQTAIGTKTFSSTSGLTIDTTSGTNSAILTMTGRSAGAAAITTTTVDSTGNITSNIPTGKSYTFNVNSVTNLTVASNQIFTGQAAGANAATPAFTFAADGNTGIYSSAADTINFAAGGTNRFQIGTAAIAVNSLPITGVTDPTNPQDAATKAYVDLNGATAIGWKAPVRLSSAANIALPPGGTTLSVDSIATANNDRVLLWGQTTGSQNGIYVVSGIGTSVVLTRATDADIAAEFTPGFKVSVLEGGNYKYDVFTFLNPSVPTLGTTTLSFGLQPIHASSGNATIPAFGYPGSNSTGLGFFNSNQPNLLAQGTEIIRGLQTAGTGQALFATGSSSGGVYTPSISFISDPDTGLVDNTNILQFVTGGQLKQSISDSNASPFTTTGTTLSYNQLMTMGGGLSTYFVPTSGGWQNTNLTVTNVGTAGTTTYYYWISATDYNTNRAGLSAAGRTTTGNATLSGTNYNTVSWSNAGTTAQGVAGYNLYRGTTANPSSAVLIAQVAQTVLTYNDQSNASIGGAAAPPIRNETADSWAPGVSGFGITSQQPTIGNYSMTAAASAGVVNIRGRLWLRQVVNPAGTTISTVGTAGATTYNYWIYFRDQAGNLTGSQAVSIATGNAALSNTNFNRLTIFLSEGVGSVDIARGANNTFIAQFLSVSTSNPIFDDVGFTTFAGTASTRNTTGDFLLDGVLLSDNANLGTATNPSFAFAQATQTGLYNSASNLGITAQGTAVATFNTAGLTMAAAKSITLSGATVTGLPDPTSASDAATKNYVDNIASGLDAKPSVKAATTSALSFTIAAGAVTQITGTTVDGITPAVNDRILIKDAPAATGAGSTNSAQPGNGIYVVTNNTTNLTVSRATDMDIWTEIPNAYTWVEQGTVNADSGWVTTADTGGTLNTTAIPFVKFVSAGVKSVGYYTALLGAVTGGTGLTITAATHGLTAASRALQVQVIDETGVTGATAGDLVYPDVNVGSTGTVTVTFAQSFAANSFRVNVTGATQ